MKGSAFRMHRARIIQLLKERSLTNSIIYMPSPAEPRESFTEARLPFVQDGIFFWLTGWDQPSSGVIIDVKNDHTTLLTPRYSPEYEILYGKAPTKEQIIDLTGSDDVLECEDHEEILKVIEGSVKPEHRLLAFPMKTSSPIDDLGTLVCAVSIARREKFDHEVEVLGRAARATSDAVKEVMRFCRPGMPEKFLEAAFLFHATLFGGQGPAFPVTSASGWHSSYLHYRANRDIVKDGDMVLFDCGIYVDHYAGDVTRTFPVNGKFSDDQKLVYEALLQAQIALIELVKPGVNLHELDVALYVQIFEVLRTIGVVTEDAEYVRDVANLFCPHSCSHHIGASVHDWSFFDGESLLKSDPIEAIKLVPNMVISIEPGVYFNRLSILKRKEDPLFGHVNFDRALELASTVCAIRIEDDVLVTSTGRTVLSTAPKTVEEIERIMSG